VRLLLDTHTFLWWTSNDPSLSHGVKTAIGDRRNEIVLSAVSTWEMAILLAKGRIALAQPLTSFIPSQLALYQFQPLMISYDHTYIVEQLPLHHKDPFDRLLIAQAMVEDLVLLTCDSKFGPYSVQTLW
jgi:PIN domain nuclease of toxin-antitoxin system